MLLTKKLSKETAVPWSLPFVFHSLVNVGLPGPSLAIGRGCGEVGLPDPLW